MANQALHISFDAVDKDKNGELGHKETCNSTKCKKQQGLSISILKAMGQKHTFRCATNCLLKNVKNQPRWGQDVFCPMSYNPGDIWPDGFAFCGFPLLVCCLLGVWSGKQGGGISAIQLSGLRGHFFQRQRLRGLDEFANPHVCPSPCIQGSKTP